jgi:two-component system, OmpR family, response regulator
MPPAPSILVVDDDEGITSLLCAYLARFGFETYVAADGVEMKRRLDAHRIDLVVLDLMLPGVDGLALAHELRAGSRIPIIMLTARCDPADRVVGLEMGADDYMSKPFEPRELVARIQTVLRRSGAPRGEATQEADTDVIRFAGWTLQRSERRLRSPKGLVVPLSNAEYQLLSAFLNAPRRVVSRDYLMAQARGRTMDGFERSIDLLVSRLRQKLIDDSGAAALIKTVRGAGYLFDAQSVQGLVAWGH